MSENWQQSETGILIKINYKVVWRHIWDVARILTT